MKQDINKLIRLTDEQGKIIDNMWKLYVEAQQAGIAFAINDNSNLVAYNALEVADCDSDNLYRGSDYELADYDAMREVFPVWDYDSLYLLRKN
ncbi:MAG: hypothetical protein IJ588_03750 [Prevotella sp.]|nr:hypothetical protein [Prevotella sp.]